MDVSHITESDQAWVGRGTDFATNLYKVSSDVKGTVEKFFSPEWAAVAFAFAFGKMSGSGGTYNFVPLLLSDGIDIPTFSYVEQIIGTGMYSALDRMAVGCAVEDLMLSIKSGPGLASATLKTNFVGTGLVTEPSGITMPALGSTVEVPLYAASATISILGNDYVGGTHDIISLDFGWKNNLRLNTGFYPGSGVDANGFAHRGRMEYNTRTCSLAFTARYESNVLELGKLESLSEGSVTITLGASASAEYFSLTIPHCIIRAAQIGDSENLVVVNVQIEPLADLTSLLLCTAEVKTPLAGVVV